MAATRPDLTTMPDEGLPLLLTTIKGGFVFNAHNLHVLFEVADYARAQVMPDSAAPVPKLAGPLTVERRQAVRQWIEAANDPAKRMGLALPNWQDVLYYILEFLLGILGPH